MAKQRLRDADEVLPRIPLVTGEGTIKMVAIAPGVTGALSAHKTRDGVVLKISAHHEGEGWEMLEDLYRKEGRMDLWQAWQAHREAVVAARRLGQSMDAFDPLYLPAEVQRRRKGHAPNKVTWTMPAVAPISMDEVAVPEPEKKGPGRPRKDAQA